ncbi:hypothetical protein BX661DRAFT_179620 [Kickxella alabastrina]|uniref:uncharacterized protein n=1 Tax=Kickxella alabastrina TaxID=61397 RepID=UPI00221F12C1|nr:uncharacterized protein BX661DRAFT_179620 [Kickxella alabastrina]KAI7831994.1 hypothetical protein BX661DRAFT_179620 [Kickxella alabastrina]
MWKITQHLRLAQPALTKYTRTHLFCNSQYLELHRQQAQDDIAEELAQHQRQSDLAPEIERLDPHTVPGLYPEFDTLNENHEEEGVEVEGDDSWYVDTTFAEPLWKRRAASHLGRPQVNVDDFAQGSLFELCRAVLEMDTENVVVMDVSDRCEWTARMVIAEAKSTRHMRAMSESMLRAIKDRSRAKGMQVPAMINVDGRESEDWMVVDLGSFVVHLMTAEARKTYNLEKLWATPLAELETEFDAEDMEVIEDADEPVGSEQKTK